MADRRQRADRLAAVGRPIRWPQLADPAWLRARYVDDELTTGEIAELIDFDCPSGTVSSWLKRHGIPARQPADRHRAVTRPGGP